MEKSKVKGGVVALLVSAWIETNLILLFLILFSVALLVSAWIETYLYIF